MRLDEAHAHDLLATPPDEFVAARNALVKELKANGDRDQAAEIAALRRPAWVDWALNVAAAEHAGEVGRFVEAAELMRDTQRSAVSGRGGSDLRTAMTGLRDRTSELARRVNGVLTGHGRPPALPEITERLAEIATSDRSADQLRAGLLLGDDGEDIGLGFGEIDEGAPPKKEAPKKTPKKSTSKQEEAAAEPAPDVSLERRRIERDLETAARVSKAARRDADRADTAVRHAKTAFDAANDVLNQAQASLDRAQSRLEREQTVRDAAHARAETAAAELERLRKAFDDL